jgi:hypothetical protein
MDEELISHIIFSIKPQSYQTLMTVLKRELNNSPNLLDLEAVIKDIQQLYAQTKKGETKKHNELVLNVQEKKKMIEYVAGKVIKRQTAGSQAKIKIRDLPILTKR